MSHYPKFDIPPSWEWTTLEEIAALISGQDFSPEKYNSERKGIPYIIGASNIRNNHVELTRWTECPSVISEKDDLLIVCKGAGIGKMGINQVGTSHIARQIQAIRPFSDHINLEFLRLVLMKGIEQIISQANGLIPGLPRDLLLKFPIPLPPLSEQNQIVQKIVSILRSIDIIEDNSKVLVRKISSIKSKILELAMQGKLVPQDPSDEPASDMLKRINPKAKIITDNPHYPKLPDNWVMTTLEEITDYQQPQVYIVKSTDYADEYATPVLTAGKSFILGYTNEEKNIFSDVPVIIFDDFTTDSHYVDFPFKVKSSAMKIISVKDGINIEYVAYFMSITRLKGDTHKRYWISEYSKLVIPLPPKEEQDRIIGKIKALNQILDEIKAIIT